MPEETRAAIDWALTQSYTDDIGRTFQVTKEDAGAMVDKVREYFNKHSITYSTFSYDSLIPYFN